MLSHYLGGPSRTSIAARRLRHSAFGFDVQRSTFSYAKKGNPAELPAGSFFDRLFGHHHAATTWATGAAAAAVLIRRYWRCRRKRHDRCKHEYVFHNSSV